MKKVDTLAILFGRDMIDDNDRFLYRESEFCKCELEDHRFLGFGLDLCNIVMLHKNAVDKKNCAFFRDNFSPLLHLLLSVQRF